MHQPEALSRDDVASLHLSEQFRRMSRGDAVELLVPIKGASKAERRPLGSPGTVLGFTDGKKPVVVELDAGGFYLMKCSQLATTSKRSGSGGGGGGNVARGKKTEDTEGGGRKSNLRDRVKKYKDEKVREIVDTPAEDGTQVGLDKQAADARASCGNIDASISFENAVAEEGKYTGQKNKEGKRHGVGKLEFKNEDVYEGIFIDNVRHGEGTMRFGNGDLYKGAFDKGRMHGIGEYSNDVGVCGHFVRSFFRSLVCLIVVLYKRLTSTCFGQGYLQRQLCGRKSAWAGHVDHGKWRRL